MRTLALIGGALVACAFAVVLWIWHEAKHCPIEMDEG
jgi:predicted outer membrane lipoprotein